MGAAFAPPQNPSPGPRSIGGGAEDVVHVCQRCGGQVTS